MKSIYPWFTAPALCLLLSSCPKHEDSTDCKEGEHKATKSGHDEFCTPDCKPGEKQDYKGVCEPAPCKASGACTGAADCCSGMCSANACVSCTKTGNACDIDTDCCSGICGADACLSCKTDGTSCSADGDCCSKHCADGTCDTLATPTESDTDPVSGSSGTTDASTGSTGTTAGTTGTTTTSGTTTTGTTTGTTSGTTGGTDTGVLPGGGYGDCYNNPVDEVCIDGEACYKFDELQVGACALQNCVDKTDCPLPSTGTAVPSCIELGGIPPFQCFLDCGGGKVCPDGMTCSVGNKCLFKLKVPPEWTCSASFFGPSHGCDCGCGALDPGCADTKLGSCTNCDDIGSCNIGPCPGTIDPNNTASCL